MPPHLSFTYGVGTGNLVRSTLLKKVKANPQDPSIRGEFAKSVHANGKILKYPQILRGQVANLYFS